MWYIYSHRRTICLQQKKKYYRLSKFDSSAKETYKSFEKQYKNAVSKQLKEYENEMIEMWTSKVSLARDMKELKMFFRGVLPILLEAVIKVVVLDMQNKNGTLQTKIEEMQK